MALLVGCDSEDNLVVSGKRVRLTLLRVLISVAGPHRTQKLIV